MSNGKGDKVRCEICGFKRRGSNHEEGKPHKEAVARLDAAVKKAG